MYKTCCPTTCHHFEYHPLVLDFKAVTSLFFALILFKVSLVVLNNETLYKSKLDMWVLVPFNNY